MKEFCYPMSASDKSNGFVVFIICFYQPKNQGKIKSMFKIYLISQIVNLKMISEVLVLRKCYQYGGEH